MKIIIPFFLFTFIAFGKPILLNIQKSGCEWCAKMDKEVFENKKVMAKLKKKFKVLVLNKDFDSEEIPNFLNPRYYPTTYVLNENMTKIIDKLPGYISAYDLLNYFDLLE